jgi:hypothetical protein
LCRNQLKRALNDVTLGLALQTVDPALVRRRCGIFDSRERNDHSSQSHICNIWTRRICGVGKPSLTIVITVLTRSRLQVTRSVSGIQERRAAVVPDGPVQTARGIAQGEQCGVSRGQADFGRDEFGMVAARVETEPCHLVLSFCGVICFVLYSRR